MKEVYILSKKGFSKVFNAWDKLAALLTISFFSGLFMGYAWRMAQGG